MAYILTHTASERRRHNALNHASRAAAAGSLAHYSQRKPCFALFETRRVLGREAFCRAATERRGTRCELPRARMPARARARGRSRTITARAASTAVSSGIVRKASDRGQGGGAGNARSISTRAANDGPINIGHHRTEETNVPHQPPPLEMCASTASTAPERDEVWARCRARACAQPVVHVRANSWRTRAEFLSARARGVDLSCAV